ncbi:MAG: DegV family protein [Ruminococcus sp.]|nr:DegV family protein [Ruminococcus sp.]
MRPIKILSDSCCDLGKDLRDKYDIDYARMNTVYHDKETVADLDFKEYTPKELYDTMRNGERIKTTQVPATEFERIFLKYAEEGYDIVYIACSSKQSGSVGTAEVVAKKIMEKTNAAIFCIDSLNASMGEGAVAIRAAEYRNQGLSVEEVYSKTMADRKKVNEFVTVHSLDALKQAGRVTGSSAFFGNLLGVKPIIIADKNGAQTPIKKVKGRRKSIEELVNLLADTMIDPENQRVYIAHADAQEEAEQIKRLVEEKIHPKEIYIGYIGPIIGASIGPEALAVFSFGKEVTFEG